MLLWVNSDTIKKIDNPQLTPYRICYGNLLRVSLHPTDNALLLFTGCFFSVVRSLIGYCFGERLCYLVCRLLLLWIGWIFCVIFARVWSKPVQPCLSSLLLSTKSSWSFCSCFHIFANFWPCNTSISPQLTTARPQSCRFYSLLSIVWLGNSSLVLV